MEVFGSYMRQKHQKPKRGFKLDSKTYSNQVPILGGKGVVYTTPQSNGNYYFRTWIAEEAKNYRVGLRTKIQEDAVKSGEDEMLDILNKLKQGHKIFGMSWGDLGNLFLEHTQNRVDTNRITQRRHATLTTQINRWIIPYLGKNRRLSDLDRNSFINYGMWRRKKTNNEVQDSTIRNEYTTINAIIKYAERSGLVPFSRFETEEIKISQPSRRDTFTLEEYRVFYKRLREWVDDAYDTHEVYYRSLVRDFILIKSNTFVRFGELHALKWSMCKVIKRKGQKMIVLDLPAEITKNNKDRQVVSRGGNYLERIKKYCEYTQKDDFVFNHQHKRGQVSKNLFYKYWNNLMKFSGFDKNEKHFSYYTLRHFGITARLYAGVPYYDVARLAGTGVDFLQKHYEHLDMTKLMDDALKTFSIDKDGFVLRD